MAQLLSANMQILSKCLDSNTVALAKIAESQDVIITTLLHAQRRQEEDEDQEEYHQTGPETKKVDTAAWGKKERTLLTDAVASVKATYGDKDK